MLYVNLLVWALDLSSIFESDEDAARDLGGICSVPLMEGPLRYFMARQGNDRKYE